ncbi:MAG: stage II sporulation protein M [Verrucomicrobiaceae bacterium]|nr:stage II sporulation protein M [Verrucomicrobiaceae bacterium]
MLHDLARFVKQERPYWEELEASLNKVALNPHNLSDLEKSRHLLALFQRACAGLSRLGNASAEPELYNYLEALVARGYAEIHSTRVTHSRFRPMRWLLSVFPQTFRKHLWAFHLSLAITLIGSALGALLISLDPHAMAAISPFPHTVELTPSERVAEEEKSASKVGALEGHQSTFSAQLMANNIGVSFKALALGITWGIGTVILLFYNGAVLGAVALDYIADGQVVFLVAWLLPHGSWEIPAILIAGQAGLLLGRALIGWGTREGMRTRLRSVVPDLATLVGGVSIMLVWAGIIESFLSQYHHPIVPYWAKIAFGVLQLVVLMIWLFLAGRKSQTKE